MWAPGQGAESGCVQFNQVLERGWYVPTSMRAIFGCTPNVAGKTNLELMTGEWLGSIKSLFYHLEYSSRCSADIANVKLI